MPDRPAPFRTWNGVEPHELRDGVHLLAVGGEQVLLGRVTYGAGKGVPSHYHDEAEQVVAIVEGEVEVTIEGETRTLRAGDVAVINRGLEHELHSATGVTFFEALSPVPRDHVPDPERDLVLGREGGALHVER